MVNTDGTYTYTPTLNYNGTDSFTFTANDGPSTPTSRPSPDGNAGERRPGGAERQRQRHEDTPINGTLAATDVDGDPDYTLVPGGQRHRPGQPDGTYTYTPNPNYNGTDSFTFTASDGTAGSNTATVTITVTPVNDAPVAQDGSAAREDTPISGTWSRPTWTARR